MASGKSADATYAELNKACTLQAHNRVLTIASKILSKDPTEYRALQCKVISLIRLEKYDECLNTIKKFPDLISHVLFEKAYAEYRLNRIGEAADTLRDCDSRELRVAELKAQVHYRKEEFHEAYSCLRNVIRNSQDDFTEERLTNLAAIAASARCFGDEPVDVDIKPGMFEAKFNLACDYLGQNEDIRAKALLEEAENLCRDALLDDPEVTEDEVNEELAPIRTQQAYLLQRAKKEEAANQLYQSVTRYKSTDPAVLAVAANNIVCINREQNIFDSRKRIKVASIDGLQHKLFAKQREQMLVNQGLFYWHTNQMDACSVKLKTVLQENPRCPRAVLLQATQFIKEKQYGRAIGLLQEYCDNRPQGGPVSHADLAVILALGQLRLYFNGQHYTPCRLPEPAQALQVADFLGGSLPDTYVNTPGVVSTRMALYMIASGGDGAVITVRNAFERINELIQTALEWYEAQDNKNPTIILLLDRCSNFFLEHGQAELAASLCERQLARLSIDPTTPASEKQALTSRLVRAYAQFDRPKAEATCRSLKFKETLTEADVDSMETTFLFGVKAVKRLGRAGGPPSGEGKIGAKSGKHSKVTPTPRPHSGDPDFKAKTNRHKKKKRKIRLPKNYQPGVMPDPERWLPRRERTQYRGKRRDRRHPPGRGPQGQVVGSSELDASTRSPKVPTCSSDPQQSTSGPVTPKQGGSSRQVQRKGRRKGR